MSTWRVPGRIEVLGKHTDYGGGRVLVGAVERAITVTAEPADGPWILASTAFDPDPVRLRAGTDPGLPAGHWGLYVQTVIERLTSNFGPLNGARITISSDLPPASGMSSSSALLTGTALALADLAALPQRPEWTSAIHDRLDLAGYMASVENGKSFRTLPGRPGVGTSGGSLDHTGMLTSRAGLLSHVEFDPARIVERVPMPDGHVFVVAVSGVLAEKTGAAREAYNRGPAALGAILAQWNRTQGREDTSLHAAVQSLTGPTDDRPLPEGDARLDPVREAAEAVARAASRDGQAGAEDARYPVRRLEQFLTESETLVPAAAQALRAGDLTAFTDLVRRSQELSTTHLGNQVPETIALVDLAADLGAVCASAFGAGFGGSVWALVPDSGATDFAGAWLERYRAEFPHPGASTIITGAGDWAERIAP